MNPLLVLIPDFLRALALAPASSSLLTPLLDEVLTIAAELIERGEAGASAFQQFATDIKVMVAAGHEPTVDEWNALKARSDAASTDIQKSASPTSS